MKCTQNWTESKLYVSMNFSKYMTCTYMTCSYVYVTAARLSVYINILCVFTVKYVYRKNTLNFLCHILLNISEVFVFSLKVILFT